MSKLRKPDLVVIGDLAADLTGMNGVRLAHAWRGDPWEEPDAVDGLTAAGLEVPRP